MSRRWRECICSNGSLSSYTCKFPLLMMKNGSECLSRLLLQEEKYLKRAYVFAKWCFEYGRKADHPPDRPLSLFEGQAGVVYMLNDFGWNPLPRFPAFQL